MNAGLQDPNVSDRFNETIEALQLEIAELHGELARAFDTIGNLTKSIEYLRKQPARGPMRARRGGAEVKRGAVGPLVEEVGPSKPKMGI